MIIFFILKISLASKDIYEQTIATLLNNSLATSEKIDEFEVEVYDCKLIIKPTHLY